ncbi:hypothetical protein AXW67_02175 [Bradyrhizobium neotropicale]|uniref:Uncharacterized protein n=1 Tax=Bradyrhizobium neotropicale TaxID=1497615 RepID=A0A176ZG89_9BRAD|nr:hypothetical protein AXW67_02175 [Bradyrhizobium neotropicale]
MLHKHHDLFCIRLHFVLRERIGIEEISRERFLTIDEDTPNYFFGGTNLETTASTMMISRQGSHRNVLVEFAVIGLEHCGQVMQGRTWLADVCSRQYERTFEAQLALTPAKPPTG